MAVVSSEEFSSWLKGKEARYAVVGNGDRETIAAYLPSNYQVIDVNPADEEWPAGSVIIAGVDVAGWTLDGYVIPRLGSGLMYAREVPGGSKEH